MGKKKSAQRGAVERRLKVAEDKYRLIAENTSDGVLQIGANNDITYVSPAYLKQVGYLTEKGVQPTIESLYAVIHPMERDTLFAALAAGVCETGAELLAEPGASARCCFGVAGSCGATSGACGPRATKRSGMPAWSSGSNTGWACWASRTGRPSSRCTAPRSTGTSPACRPQSRNVPCSLTVYP